MSKPLKLVIFDCDGTLVDSQQMIVAAMHHAFRAIGLSAPPSETLLGIVGLSLSEAFTHLGNGDSRYPVADLVAHYREAFVLLR
jgi:phosphoglycolate phosphatase